jgi:hypothetical protein
MNNLQLDNLCAELARLRKQAKAIEDKKSAVEDQIIKYVGVDSRAETDLFKVNVRLISRSVFSKENFISLFGEAVYPKVTREIAATQIYLTERV